MRFEEMLREKQAELEMSTNQFAKHIGLHRTWLTDMWNPRKPRRPLRDRTMYLLHNRLDIPYEVMEEYNIFVLNERNK